VTRVFLSASFPSGDRGDAVAPYRPADIAAAASSAVEAVLRTGCTLAFGGHPTISPIVLHVAGLLGAGEQVEIWQSEWFRDSITDEVHRLVDHERARLIFTPLADDLTGSLLALRRAMLDRPVDAAFFVGGMEGIRDEYDLLLDRHRRAAVFLFSTPGGMSARIAADAEPLDPASTADRTAAGDGDAPTAPIWRLDGRAYGSSALAALAHVGALVQDRRHEL
jgi:hypothetical protein